MAPTHFSPSPQSFVIESGQTTRQVLTLLQDKKLLQSPMALLIFIRLTGNTQSIKAGSYELYSPLSAYHLFKKITDGDVQSTSFRIIEGSTWKEVRNALAKCEDLRHDIQHLSDQELRKALDINEGHMEGQLFPDTYFYAKGTSDLSILKRAHALMQKNLLAAWKSRSKDSRLTSPHALLIMASLIEKETGKAADRELIAGVFNNRLRLGMRLQTDPTVIYGMGERYRGNIRKVDLLADTVYNTYRRVGLPPSPIAMPGRAALLAAAKPAPTRALYFVARGDGSSQFSETLLEHNRAVNYYVRRVKR